MTKILQDTIEDLIGSLMYYDRKEGDELTRAVTEYIRIHLLKMLITN